MEYRVFTGDDKGQIKSIRCTIEENDKTKETRMTSTTMGTPATTAEQIRAPIQRLRCHQEPGSESSTLAAAQADGQITAYSYTQDSNDLPVVSSWKEARLSSGDKFVGLEAMSGQGWLSCTQHGRLRLSYGLSGSSETPNAVASLPMRLNEIRISPSFTSLAYGGNEVDLSVWDIERTFSEKSTLTSSNDTSGKKRKKGKADLMYAEIWRAKQLPNDALSLRQPVHITSLAFLRNSSQQPDFHIITGNKSGAVRRFDTRAARRPVANWDKIAKIGGIKGVECGQNEHEVFVSDNGCNLSALDVRNGKICYSYRGLPGAVSSFAPISTTHLASVSLDRILRIHSVFAPPSQTNEQQLKKGSTLGHENLKSTPTAVVWDGYKAERKAADADEDEDVWQGMQTRGGRNDSDEESGEERQQKRLRK
ncbi:hypothetical protein RhiJN_14151 [Ceratobasidium sp. AG-Ba]|nr:hypothetical protein RhiJN_14151 [Ceratobasidium sp. AG-Ba]